MISSFSITFPDEEPSRLKLEASYPGITSQQLYDAFTKPELLVQWWPQQAQVNLLSDGDYKYSWIEMNWHLIGRFITMEPYSRLSFTWQWQHEPNQPERVVDIEFIPFENGCKILLTHSSYLNSPSDQEERQSHLDGWKYFLERLSKIF